MNYESINESYKIESNNDVPSILKNSKDSLKKLRYELNRVGDLLDSNSFSSSVAILNKTIRDIQIIKTPAQVISFLAEKVRSSKMRKIQLQPTSIARRD